MAREVYRYCSHNEAIIAYQSRWCENVSMLSLYFCRMETAEGCSWKCQMGLVLLSCFLTELRLETGFMKNGGGLWDSAQYFSSVPYPMLILL